MPRTARKSTPVPDTPATAPITDPLAAYQPDEVVDLNVVGEVRGSLTLNGPGKRLACLNGLLAEAGIVLGDNIDAILEVALSKQEGALESCLGVTISFRRLKDGGA